MLKTVNDKELQEYVWLNADKSLREIQAGILQTFEVSKSLKWISKVRKEYLHIEETTEEEGEIIDIERDPEIIDLKKEILKTQLQKRLELEEQELIDVYDLVETLKEKKADNQLLKNKLEQAIKKRPNYVPDALCPKCKGRFLLEIRGLSGHKKWVKCFVCGKDYKLD